jgi:hypothetical protein
MAWQGPETRLFMEMLNKSSPRRKPESMKLIKLDPGFSPE